MKKIMCDITVITKKKNWEKYLNYLSVFNPQGDISLSVLEYFDLTNVDYNLLPLEEVLNNREIILSYKKMGYICIDEKSMNLL